MACSPAISLYAGRRASAIAGALFAFARAWRGRSDHAKKKAGQTSQARRKRRPLRSCHGSAGNRQKRTAETAPARSQAARWSQNPTDAHRAAHRASKRPKPGGEYPAEEAPRKTANTEPTEGQTDAAAETEAQDPAAEPAEPEGEALSLDSIDDLVLPGDVDLGEEQQSQRWRITDDALAPLSMDPLQSSASQIRVRTPSDAPLLRARMAARTRHSRKVEETDSRGSKAPETARRALRGSAKKKTRAQLFLPENAKIKKYKKISQKLLTKPPARCIMYVQSTPKVHTRR